MRRASALACTAVVAAFGLAACGGGGDDNSDSTAAATPPATTAGGGGAGGGGSTVDISTPSGSDLAFQKDVSAKSGTVTIDFDNKQPIPHDVKVEDSSGQELGGTELTSSGTTTGTVDLQPGTYTFFCDVPGHREAGMEGTLTVK
jgi:uncharacterized cupredoxin-like copper-binding protein